MGQAEDRAEAEGGGDAADRCRERPHPSAATMSGSGAK